MNTSQTADAPKRSAMEPVVILSVLFAFIIPGAGHLFLRKFWRAGVFFVSSVCLCAAGFFLDGTLFSLLRMNASEGFFQFLAALGNLGLGFSHLLLHWTGLGYGDATVRTNEYGTTFLLVTALMNILIALNAFDLAMGEKE
jgi:hypothetical protein